jgi:DNA modification methylase
MQGIKRSKPFAKLTWPSDGESAVPAARLQPISELVSESSTSQDLLGTLIEGENLAVMTALLPEYEGQVDLVYADPPFLTGNAYRMRIGRQEDSRSPDDWRTTRGYEDKWRDGAEYLDMLHPRLQLMHRLLSPHGSLYLHLDWHASAYARVLLDEIFGPDRLLNEIIWVYHGPSPIRSAFKRKHDTILVYTKSKDYTFNHDAVRVPYNPSTIKTFETSEKAGFGKQPDLERGKVPEDWWYFPVVARLHNERTGFPTQKPESLMERIVLASSNPGDLVADFFSGSGTTPIVAKRHSRRWLACDPAPHATLTTYRRFLLEEDPSTLRLLADNEFEYEPELEIDAQVTVKNETVTISLEGVQSPTPETMKGLEDVIFWEVDWEYDGTLFRSSSYSARPWRKGDILTEFTHQYSRSGLQTLAIRVADVYARIGMKEIEIYL